VPVLLALASSFLFGVGDFAGGLATRRARVFSVVVVSQLFGLALAALLVPVLGGSTWEASDLAWGAGAGLFGALGLAALYQGLSIAPASLVAAMTAVLGAVVPVSFGLATGERPGTVALAGTVLALPALVLVTARDEGAGGDDRRGLLFGAVAGTAFGLFFVLLDRTGEEAGVTPLVTARVASLALTALVALAVERRIRVGRPALPLVAAAGLMDMGANICFLVAVREGLLAPVAVLVSLAPAWTILSARLVLGETITARQGAGLVLAGAGIALIAVA
jgi:drug/metabolite transporter (DMT)-like permease